jgi:diguanylate cyclase (GGDEF)-like protein
MGVISALSDMHREAVEQVRSGDHSAFLVGFLTTSTMLELAGLPANDLRLDAYATAVADTITQLSPIDRLHLVITPEGFAPVSASIGFHGRHVDPASMAHRAQVEVAGVGRVELAAAELAEPLAAAGFLTIAAEQIGVGLRQITEAEHRRRRAAVADTLALVASLDQKWGQAELDALAGSLATMPGAHAARIAVGATRLAGVLEATSGRLDPGADGDVVHRVFTIDERVQAEVDTAYCEPPTTEQLGILDDVLSTLAAGLSRIEENIRLTSEAETDQLTGVANRRRVSKSLAAARAMADRRDEPFAVLLFDLDHFKSVNDRFGHAVGDIVLARFAELLLDNVRPFDTVARWGGEEFLLLCPGCNLDGAVAIGQRILRASPDSFGQTLPAEVRQTTSVGIAVYPEHGRTPETVIHAADEALYRAKREGRDRWAAAGVTTTV